MVGLKPNTNGHARGAAVAGPPNVSRFDFVGSDEFLTSDFDQRFLIPGVLVANQPGVIAGPSKAMKTSLMVDMAVSLASRTSFLGRFDVPDQVRVALVSGESGKATLQETAWRVLAAKRLDSDALGNRLQWCFELPQFNDTKGMKEFAEQLKALAVDIVFIDPVYLCLGGNIDHANLFDMGAAFRVVADVLLLAGVTPVLVHHANRQLRTGEPMELQHLAYSGLEQFARQFVLMNRQRPYKGDGVHDLWMSAGGSAGHGGLWALHIKEGTVDASFRGRFWSVDIKTEAQDMAARIDKKQSEQAEKKRKKVQERETNLLKAIDAANACGEPCTKTFVRERYTSLKGPVLKEIRDRLLEARTIEVYEAKVSGGQGAKQSAEAYRRASC